MTEFTIHIDRGATFSMRLKARQYGVPIDFSGHTAICKIYNSYEEEIQEVTTEIVGEEIYFSISRDDTSLLEESQGYYYFDVSKENKSLRVLKGKVLISGIKLWS